MMAALRAQDKLAMAAVQGMKDSYAANSEVAGVRAQLAAIPKNSLPTDVASAATALETKLTTFGGPQRGGRGPGGGGGGFGGFNLGLPLEAGTYNLKLTVGGKDYTTRIVVENDPGF